MPLPYWKASMASTAQRTTLKPVTILSSSHGSFYFPHLCASCHCHTPEALPCPSFCPEPHLHPPSSSSGYHISSLWKMWLSYQLLQEAFHEHLPPPLAPLLCSPETCLVPQWAPTYPLSINLSWDYHIFLKSLHCACCPTELLKGRNPVLIMSCFLSLVQSAPRMELSTKWTSWIELKIILNHPSFNRWTLKPTIRAAVRMKGDNTWEVFNPCSLQSWSVLLWSR